jgi:membrane-associated phospholipid phosphatase
MDAKLLAREITNLVVFLPPLAYGVLLAGAGAYLELIVTSFVFFAFLPQYFIEQFAKLPRSPKTKVIAVWQFLLAYAAGFAIQFALNAPAPALAFSISLVVGHLIAYYVTPNWLISTHGMIAAQSLAVFYAYGRVETLLLLVVFIIMGWSRVYLKAHTPLQYLTGGGVGAILTLVALGGTSFSV